MPSKEYPESTLLSTSLPSTARSSAESTHRTIRSTDSMARPQTVRSSTYSTRPLSPASTPCPPHTTNPRSSTTHPSASSSHYSTSEKAPLLPTSQTNQAHQAGEQIWAPTSHASGGLRTETKHQRGCMMPRASLYDQANWKRVVQSIIGYEFGDVDLLEEALESPDSGVTCVGKSHRHFLDGNRGLAGVGEAAMRLVLRDQCYLFKVPEADAVEILDRTLKWENLAQVGMNTKLQQYIRPRAILQGSQSRNWIRLIVNDFKVLGCDPGRTIANGIKAIIGAVYFDGGFESARRVMAQFGLIIKVPKPAPVPMPPGQIVKYA